MPTKQPTPAEEAELRRVASLALAIQDFGWFVEHYVRIESDSVTRGNLLLVPFDFQRERIKAWQRGDSEIILKSRQIGFSWLTAAYCLWTAAYHESSHVGVFSAGAREMRKFMRKIRYIQRRLPEELQGNADLAQESITFANESTISGFPSTPDAGIGDTNKLVVFDEWAMHPYGADNLNQVLPTVASGGQIIVMSTANPSLGPAGHFYEQWQFAQANPEIFNPIFVGWDCRPDRDPEFLERERKKHVGQEAAFKANYPTCPEDAFESHTGLVYGPDHFGREAWEKSKIAPPAVPWEECKWRIAAHDPGGADPSALLLIGVSNNEHIHVYAELYHRGRLSALDISEYLGKADKVGHIDFVVSDPSQGSLVETLRQLGWNAHGANNDKGDGIGQVRAMLLENRLTISPTCTNLITEFGTYWWPTRQHLQAGGKATDTRTPGHHHADALDALRYAVLAILKGLPTNRSHVEHKYRVPDRRGHHRETFRERMARKHK